MVGKNAYFFIFSLFLHYSCNKTNNYKIICFYDNRARGHSADYQQNNYVPGLCTHLVYGFAKISKSPKSGSYELVPESKTDISDGYQEVIKAVFTHRNYTSK